MPSQRLSRQVIIQERRFKCIIYYSYVLIDNNMKIIKKY